MIKGNAVKVKAACAVALLLVSAEGFAESATTNMVVSATVVSSCKVSASPLDFGAISIEDTSKKDVQGSIKVRCTSQTPYAVSFDAGTGTGATTNDRLMKVKGTGTDQLRYGLYQDQNRQQNWGNTTGNAYTGTGDGTDQALSVYGSVPPGQNVVAGTYTDTVTVTVAY